MDLKIETKYLLTSADEIEEILSNIRQVNTSIGVQWRQNIKAVDNLNQSTYLNIKLRYKGGGPYE